MTLARPDVLLTPEFWLLAPLLELLELLELLGLLELLPLRCSTAESGLEQDGQQNDHSFHDVLVITRNVLQVHKIANNSENQHSDAGSRINKWNRDLGLSRAKRPIADTA